MTAIKHQARPLRFITLDTGCQVCTSHKPNADGYIRKTWGNARSGDRHAEMLHRVIFKLHGGVIPEGHELDHLCGVRSCCNAEHLNPITRSEHATITNRLRWRPDKYETRMESLANG